MTYRRFHSCHHGDTENTERYWIESRAEKISVSSVPSVAETFLPD